MTHDQALELLPLYSAGELAAPGELEVHLAGCASCAAELARYRELTYSVRALRSTEAEPSEALRSRLVASIPPPGVRYELGRIARHHRRELSVGTAVVGATAIGLLWWRARRRANAGAAGIAAG